MATYRGVEYCDLSKKDRERVDAGILEADEPILVCPECGSDAVTVTAEQKFMVNSGDHYCHSRKIYDSDSKSSCLECDWEGQRQDLKEKE